MPETTDMISYYAHHHDETPITEEWLEANCSQVDEGCDAVYYMFGSMHYVVGDRSEWHFVGFNGLRLANITTVGQLNAALDLERRLEG